MSEDKQNETKGNKENKCLGMSCDFFKKHLDYVIGGTIILALVAALIFVIVKDDNPDNLVSEKLSKEDVEEVEEALEGAFEDQKIIKEGAEVKFGKIIKEDNLYKVNIKVDGEKMDVYASDDYSKIRILKGKKVSKKVSKKVEDALDLDGAFADIFLKPGGAKKATLDEVREDDIWYNIYLTIDGKQEVEMRLTKDYVELIPQTFNLKVLYGDYEPIDKMLNDTAVKLGMDEGSFGECLKEGRYADKIENSIQEGAKAGVQGTPHNVVIANGIQYTLSGARDAEDIKKVLDIALTGGSLDGQEILKRADKNVKLVDTMDHARGNKNATVIFIEYSDVDCPYCKKHHETMEKLVEEYSDRMQFVFRPFPLAMHPDAGKKSEAAECAKELGGEDAYWKYLDAMFKSGE